MNGYKKIDYKIYTSLLKYMFSLLLVLKVFSNTQNKHILVIGILELMVVMVLSDAFMNRSCVGQMLNSMLMLLFNLQMAVMLFANSYVTMVMLTNLRFLEDLSGKAEIYLMAAAAVVLFSFLPIKKIKRNTWKSRKQWILLLGIVMIERIGLLHWGGTTSPLCSFGYLGYQQFNYQQLKQSIQEGRISYYSETVENYKEKDSSLVTKPNVVLIFTEGLSENIIEDSRQIVPNIKKYQKQSLSFENYYNHTFATLRGLIGQLYSGYQLDDLDSNALISIQSIFSDEGYNTFFINTEPHNEDFAAYLKNFEFDKLISEKDYVCRGEQNSISDKDAYKRLFQLMEEQEQEAKPFFISMYTFGTHASFDSVDEKYEDGNDSELNKFYDMDYQFGAFMEKLENSTLADDTIVIFTTDHATYLDDSFRASFPDYERKHVSLDAIPFFIYHRGIKPERVDANGRNSLNLAPTILDYLDISAPNFFLGSSLFAEAESSMLETTYNEAYMTYTTKKLEPEPLQEQELSNFELMLQEYYGTKATVKKQKEFFYNGISVFATNSQGEQLHGVRSEVDGNWYLFVPFTQELSELTVSYMDSAIGEEVYSVSDTFSSDSNKMEIVTVSGKRLTLTVMQSKLPAVQIYLKDITLDAIHQDKMKKHHGNTVVLEEPTGMFGTISEFNVEIKGRGNSTREYWDKKPYQIKFQKEISILGMKPAKKWILLANAADDSLMRNQLIFQMAQKLDMEYVPQFEYVDLWINGEYRGIYLIGEKVEIEDSRLNLLHPEGAMFEQDMVYYKEEEYWFFNDELKKPFALKDVVEDDPAIIKHAIDTFQTSINELMSLVYTTSPEEITLEMLSNRIDVDSFIKYYLINEYVLNRESFETSFYWYQDGPDDVLHLGPIWDFDTCIGNDSVDANDRYGYNHTLFAYLLEIPEFLERTEYVFDQYQSVFTSMISNTEIIQEYITDSAKMNYLKWNYLGKPNPKTVLTNYHDTFEKAVSYLQKWLEERKDGFIIGNHPAVSGEINDDCNKLKIYYEDYSDSEKVVFSVWNRENKKQLRLWETAERVNGVWQGEIDLTMFDAAGLYQIEVYVDDNKKAAATSRIISKKAAEQIYLIDTKLSEDGKNVRITCSSKAYLDNVRFAVWSEVNDQDDLRWFNATENDQGQWEFVEEAKMFPDKGVYYIHAYGDVNGISECLNVTIIKINGTKK